jgi:hypothetical protein
MSSIFAPDWLSWPTKSYKYPHPTETFPRGGDGETWNHEQEAVPVKIGGGNATTVAPGRFSNLSDITNTATMMKRE